LAAAGQNLPQDLPVFRLRATPMLGGPDTEGPDDVVIEIADG
jgi:hypothetical protein